MRPRRHIPVLPVLFGAVLSRTPLSQVHNKRLDHGLVPSLMSDQPGRRRIVLRSDSAIGAIDRRICFAGPVMRATTPPVLAPWFLCAATDAIHSNGFRMSAGKVVALSRRRPFMDDSRQTALCRDRGS